MSEKQMGRVGSGRLPAASPAPHALRAPRALVLSGSFPGGEHISGFWLELAPLAPVLDRSSPLLLLVLFH